MVEVYDFENGNLNPDKWNCDIDFLDIQACYCGRISESDLCIAQSFSNIEQIHKVYAWSGECQFRSKSSPIFNYNEKIMQFPNGYNISPPYPKEKSGQYVLFEDGEKKKELGYLMAPLQYG